MPATSKSQQRLMGMVHAEQKGSDTGSPQAKEIAKTMDPQDAIDFAKTPHAGLPEKSDAEKRAFVEGFLTKCAEIALPSEKIAAAVYGICKGESDARDAFELFVKEAVDLSTIPQATQPAPAPCRSKPILEKPAEDDAARVHEKMMKKYASGEEDPIVRFLNTPVI